LSGWSLIFIVNGTRMTLIRRIFICVYLRLSAFICSICVICVLFWGGTRMTLIRRMVADFFDVDNLAVIGMVTEFYLRLSARSA
jgi:hypothetical protein